MKAINLSLMVLLSIIGTSDAFAGGYAPGDEARDFSLKNVDGKMVSMADFKDAHGYIVIFTCNHCPFSKMYEDRIMALDVKYSKNGFPVIAINPNDPIQFPEDDFEGMKQRASEKGFKFPYLFDETQEIAKAYGAQRTPHVYLLDASMKVQYIGAIDDNSQDASAVQATYLEDAIANVSKGLPAEPNFTKAIGCSIKWKK